MCGCARGRFLTYSAGRVDAGDDIHGSARTKKLHGAWLFLYGTVSHAAGRQAWGAVLRPPKLVHRLKVAAAVWL
jgi:hypothetical protein